MDKMYTCYCGLYCENCAVKVKVEPAARVLYGEMKAAGFEDVISFIPGGEGFWSFLKGMADGDGICISTHFPLPQSAINPVAARATGQFKISRARLHCLS